VIGAFYYLKIVKTMYFDAPAAPYGKDRSTVEYGIMTVCAAVIVVGYLLNPMLDRASAAAAAALF
jgi:NADH-quinone oxidoreductase subunit N